VQPSTARRLAGPERGWVRDLFIFFRPPGSSPSSRVCPGSPPLHIHLSALAFKPLSSRRGRPVGALCSSIRCSLPQLRPLPSAPAANVQDAAQEACGESRAGNGRRGCRAAGQNRWCAAARCPRRTLQTCRRCPAPARSPSPSRQPFVSACPVPHVALALAHPSCMPSCLPVCLPAPAPARRAPPTRRRLRVLFSNKLHPPPLACPVPLAYT
jgi:hypothetical protein